MVRRYRAAYEEDYSDSEYGPYVIPHMVESQFGEWVKLETYQNETARLKAQIERQKKLIDGLVVEVTKSMFELLE